MGYDIKVVCEYMEPDGTWISGQDYSIEHYVDGTEYHNVIEPIAEFRNYNLFRPLANIHNTQRCIDNEIEMWESSVKRDSWHRVVPSSMRNRFRDEYYPETDNPTVVINYTVGLPDDCTKLAKDMIVPFANTNDDIYSVTLDVVKKFVDTHTKYAQLREMYDKAYANYLKCNKVYCQKYNDTLPLSRFRIIYGFNL